MKKLEVRAVLALIGLTMALFAGAGCSGQSAEDAAFNKDVGGGAGKTPPPQMKGAKGSTGGGAAGMSAD